MLRVLLVALSASLLPVAVFAQANHPNTPPKAPAPMPGLACFENMPAPQYPKTALKDHIDGSVWTTTKISPSGSIDNIETNVASAWSQGAALLTPPVEKSLHAAKIKSDCDGKTVLVVFRYQLHGEPTPAPKVTSRADGDDLLWIESQPMGAPQTTSVHNGTRASR